MFRITKDPSSRSLVQCLDKNYKNDSIVSVDMDKVGVMAAYCDPLCVRVVHCIYSELHTRTTGQNMLPNTDLVHINGRDRIILVIFIQALYKAP